MSIVLIDLENTENTISRRVAKTVTEDILRLTGMENVEIVYNERRGAVNNPANSNNPEEAHLRLDTGDRVYVEYTEQPNDERFSLLKTMREEPSIFRATDLGIYIAPVCLKTIMEFRFEIRSKSYDKLNKWMNRLRHNLTIRDVGNTHNVLYEYTIPEGVVAYIYDVHALTERVEGYNRSLKDFINTHFSKGLISRQNLSGSQKRLAMNVMKSGTLGFFTDVPTEIETDKDRTSSSVTLSYRIEYDKAAFLGMEYQVYIHNQRIPQIYIDMFHTPATPKLDDYRGIPQIASLIYEVVGKEKWRFVSIEDTFMDPADRWHPAYPTPNTSTMAILPLAVDLDDRHDVLDLHEISNDVSWDDLIEVMELLGDKLLNGNKSPILVELYAVSDKESNLELSIDGNIHVRSLSILNPRERHYLRIAISNDLSKCFEGLTILQKYPSLLLRLLQTLDPRVTMDHLTVIGNGTYVTTDSLKDVISNLAGTNAEYKSFYGVHRFWAINSTLSVTAKKE